MGNHSTASAVLTAITESRTASGKATRHPPAGRRSAGRDTLDGSAHGGRPPARVAFFGKRRAENSDGNRAEGGGTVVTRVDWSRAMSS
ncbi:MAG: hypothetical protein ACR2OA_13335 [Rubripirellula sp.]